MSGQRERDIRLSGRESDADRHGIGRVSGRGRDAKAPDRQGDVPHRLGAPMTRADRYTRDDRANAARRANADVEVGRRRAGALGEDPRRWLRNPAASGIPGKEREERPEAEAAGEAGDAVVMA